MAAGAPRSDSPPPISSYPPPNDTARRRNDYIDRVDRADAVVQPAEAESFRGRWREHFGFGQEAPLWVELGCGSAMFAQSLAERNPGSLVVGVDRRYKRVFLASRRAARLPNLVVVRYDGIYLRHVFDAEVDRLYLIYPEPWPRRKHVRNRLYENLERYRTLLAPGATLHVRTDSGLVLAGFERAVRAAGGVVETSELERAGRTDLSAFDRLFEHKGEAARESVARLG